MSCQPFRVEHWQLSAREQIRELVARYNLAGDRGRVDEMLSLFAPDAALAVDGTEHAGHDAIRAVFTGAGVAFPRLMRHLTATLSIDVQAPDAAAAECYFQVLTDAGLDHWGRYRDSFACIDGTWLFARRSVRVDGATPGGWASERGYPAHDAP